MYDQTTRINAAITYLFLAPFFLFARRGTPYAHPFVRAHAKTASRILGIWCIAIFIYFFIRKYLFWGFFGISAAQVLLWSIMIPLVIVLIFGAYRAFRGIDASAIFSERSADIFQSEFQTSSYTDADKIRILLSFVPFLGVFIAARYPSKDVLIGRKVGNFAAMFMILSLIGLKSVNTVFFLLMIVYLVGIVTTGVQLFLNGQFLMLSIYRYIPSYHEFEAYVKTIFQTSKEWIMVAFGHEKMSSWGEKYAKNLRELTEIVPNDTPYWTSPVLIAIPFLNLFMIPSYFSEKYRRYRLVIAEGVFLTILVALVIWFYASNNYYLYLLLFPLCTLMAEVKNTLYIRAPITSIAGSLVFLFTRTTKQVQKLREHHNEANYHYSHTESENIRENFLKNPEENISENIHAKNPEVNSEIEENTEENPPKIDEAIFEKNLSKI